ncbi:MAG: hypothetical protein DMF80_16315 [Acidobacteria bacterium]|nr:MAG: hypothetical protein DMF80_16315 [Acidobacteriota bacterium]
MAARIVEGVVAPLSRPARLLYVDRANGAGFRMLAACRAYQLAHGRLPHDARAALAESGLQWPIDVVTGRPIGYRLETAGATAWLAGFDGRDDGGRTPYLDLVEATIVPGTDLLYPLGSPPPTLRTLASRAGALPKPQTPPGPACRLVSHAHRLSQQAPPGPTVLRHGLPGAAPRRPFRHRPGREAR